MSKKAVGDKSGPFYACFARKASGPGRGKTQCNNQEARDSRPGGQDGKNSTEWEKDPGRGRQVRKKPEREPSSKKTQHRREKKPGPPKLMTLKPQARSVSLNPKP